eukprot:2414221-Prymnesium_polylepis.3
MVLIDVDVRTGGEAWPWSDRTRGPETAEAAGSRSPCERHRWMQPRARPTIWTLLSRAATGSAGRPSPTGLLRSCSLPLLYYHDADSLGCGRDRHTDSTLVAHLSLAHLAVVRCA